MQAPITVVLLARRELGRQIDPRESLLASVEAVGRSTFRRGGHKLVEGTAVDAVPSHGFELFRLQVPGCALQLFDP